MKHCLKLLCSSLLIISTTSCTSISKNRANLLNLEVGMTKQQVIDTMGEPLKFESYHKPNVWFYHTEQKWMDFTITRDECTPILFDEMEMVSGWGFDFYKEKIRFR